MGFRLLVSGLIFGSAMAYAQARGPKSFVDRFLWPSNGQLELVVNESGRPVVFKGAMGEKGVTLSSSGYVAHVMPYPMFASIIFYREGSDEGQLFLLERTAKDSEQMNDSGIRGRALEMPKDLAYAIERFASLKKLPANSDPSFVFRTMVSYFEAFPDRKLDQFADDVENGVDVVQIVHKPDSRLAKLPNGPAVPSGPQTGEQSAVPAVTPPEQAPRARAPQQQYRPPRGGYDGDPFYRQPRQQYQRPTYETRRAAPPTDPDRIRRRVLPQYPGYPPGYAPPGGYYAPPEGQHYPYYYR